MSRGSVEVMSQLSTAHQPSIDVVSSLKDHLQAEGLSQFGPTDIWMSRPCLQAPIPGEVSFEVQTELSSLQGRPSNVEKSNDNNNSYVAT